MMETVQKNEFIAFRFKGYANESLFDSNIEVELKKLDPKAKAEESIIVVGKGMVVPGLDRSFEGKEIGKEYEGIIRSTFLLNPYGEIIYSWKNVKADGHVEQVINKLRELEK